MNDVFNFKNLYCPSLISHFTSSVGGGVIKVIPLAALLYLHYHHQHLKVGTLCSRLRKALFLVKLTCYVKKLVDPYFLHTWHLSFCLSVFLSVCS